jgi:predicted GNAT family acetyltransferase|tara:strand:- start:41 stop:238 length:198 start_codon:yes stop_codon:yes gene_type:complete
MGNKMTKQEWLEEKLFVDMYGREYNLSDVPMTFMTRKEAFEKRGYGKKMVKQLWKEIRREESNSH